MLQVRGLNPLLSSALGLTIGGLATPAASQYAPLTEPRCACGPSAMPAYAPAHPQPARRALDGSARSGIQYREGPAYATPRTNLGTSAFEAFIGPARWSGLYLGAHGGYSFGDTAVEDIRLGATNASSPFGGLHFGRNWQIGALVFGIEGDVSKRWAEGSKAFSSGFELKSGQDLTGSLRARAGYAFGNVLAYATVGGAATSRSITASQGGTSWRGPETYAGTVYGGGLEWQIMPQISLRGEVLRYDFGSRDMLVGGAQAPVKIDETVARGGVTFRFN